MISDRTRFVPVALLVATYFAIYFGAVFARIADVEFMSADPHSIMNGINALFENPVYNMNGHYHSIVYGWTYFAMNFLAVAPLKLLGVTDPVFINVTVRALLFTVGLGLVLVFYFIARSQLGTALAMAAAFALSTNHIAARAFLEIHPESTGVLLYLLGLFFLGKTIVQSGSESRNYLIAIVFLSLSALAKQPFAIIAFFSWISFAILFAEKNGVGVVAFARSRTAVRFFVTAVCVFLVAAFIIHPYAFFEFETFITGQLRPLRHASGNTFSDAAQRWWAALTEEPLAVVNFALLLALPLTRQLKLSRLLLCSLVSSCLITLLFIFMQKLVPRTTYLYPLYPLYYLNICYVLKRLYVLVSGYSGVAAKAMAAAGLLTCAPLLILNVTQAVYLAHSRVFLNGYADKNLSWDYLKAVPETRRIAFSPAVAVPPGFDKKCHPWRYCRTPEGIEAYEPEIVFIRRKNNRVVPHDFGTYVTSNNFQLDRTLSVDRPRVLWCGLVGKSIGYPKSSNRPPSKHTAAFFAQLSMLQNLDVRRTITRTAHCATNYVANLKARLAGQYSGRDMEVWVKPSYSDR